MPLETTVQNFDIVLRNEDFSSNVLLSKSKDTGSQYYDNYRYVKIGKWIEVVPVQLLNTTRKLFMDVTNKIYNIENINQAIRLFIRPLIFYYTYRNSTFYIMCNSNTPDEQYPFGSYFLSGALGSPVTIIKTTGRNSDDLNSYICTVDHANEELVTALGDIPEQAKVNTFYLDGKFTLLQPHIEHKNSGEYSLYNNIRAITLPAGTAAGTKLNDFDLGNITNGFFVNSYISNPKMAAGSTSDISFDYALFNLKLKYINDIVDLPTSYLSYWPMYKRFIGIFKSGNPATMFSNNRPTILTQNTYSAFEFFLAPVGEAS